MKPYKNYINIVHWFDWTKILNSNLRLINPRNKYINMRHEYVNVRHEHTRKLCIHNNYALQFTISCWTHLIFRQKTYKREYWTRVGIWGDTLIFMIGILSKEWCYNYKYTEIKSWFSKLISYSYLWHECRKLPTIFEW